MQISAKPTLVAATIFASLTLAFVDCKSTLAGIEVVAHAKLRPSANSTGVAQTTARKAHSIVRGKVAARRAKMHLSIVGSKTRGGRQLALKPNQKTSGQAAHWKKHSRAASDKSSSKKQVPTLGLASFYSEDAETASGEGFDKHKLAAAHPTLPFGTRLRVTNVRNGRSVIVRVNERGPFVRGRVIDVTSTAAEALGMIREGVINVKLDIVR